MKRRTFWLAQTLLVLVSAWEIRAAEPEGPAPIHATLAVNDKVLNPVPDNLFGQFMERPRWGGETGPEAVFDPEGPGFLRPNVFALIEAMHIPVIRFPGGTEIDYLNWTDMISNAPDRTPPGRPVTPALEKLERVAVANHYGYDEYFALRDRLGCETILVANFLDALLKRRPVEEAARHNAGGLVAYANAALTSSTPELIRPWIQSRVANGHLKPFGAEYVQIGNEWFMEGYKEAVPKAIGSSDPETLAAWYLKCLHAYIDAIRTVDPGIKIIIDAEMAESVSAIVLADPVVRSHCWGVAIHTYAPWAIQKIYREGEPVRPGSISSQEWWQYLASLPGGFTDGQNQASALRPSFKQSSHFKAVETEWNWNGWFEIPKDSRPAFDPLAAAGVGAASYFNGLIRHGDRIALATQSMLVGVSWGITAVRSFPDGTASYLPTGLAALLYANHHGDQRLASSLSGAPTYRSPLSQEPKAPDAKAVCSSLDIVVTANANKIYVHAVNREFARPAELKLDLAALGNKTGNATQIYAVMPAEGRWKNSGMDDLKNRPVHRNSAQQLIATLPPRSFSVIGIERNPKN